MQIKTETLNEKINVFKILLVIFVLVFAINISIIELSKKAVKQKEEAALEANRPANISLTVIKDPSCTDCADIAPIINAVKKTNVKITKEDTFEATSVEAKKLISELEIKKLPTLIIKGELNKNADVAKLLSQVGVIKNDVFTLNYFVAPYMDLASNSEKGKVTVTFITDKTCAECYDVNPFKQILANNLGMINPAVVTADKSDRVAQDLIRKYKIEAIPAFVISGDITEYSRLAGVWLQIGTLEKDGVYVLREIKKVNQTLVYRDLATGKIVKPAAATPVASPTATATPASSPK